MPMTDSSPTSRIIATIDSLTSIFTDSDPSAWVITTIFAAPPVFGAIDSVPTDWYTTSVDDEPITYGNNSAPTAWVITKVSPEFEPAFDSTPTAWVIATVSTGPLNSGIFLVLPNDTLIEVAFEIF